MIDKHWNVSNPAWEVVYLPLLEVLATCEDGDGHGWELEFDLLWSTQTEYMDRLALDIQKNGITMPILVGTDNRIWDGHHRLAVAMQLGLEEVPIERKKQ